jgi:hypothetical protein
VIPGLVSQTILSRGGIFRRARIRSRQLAGASDLGKWGFKLLVYRVYLDLMNGAKRPRSSTLSAWFYRPLIFTGRCVRENQIRRKRTRQNLLVIRSYGLDGCESMGKSKPLVNLHKVLRKMKFLSRLAF